MVESGPASGVWGAAELGRLIGEPQRARARHRRHDGQVLADQERKRQDHDRLLDRARPPLGRVSDHGAGRRPRRDRQGGGSIAWVDDFGKLQVGPQSAGALPGPAAYGRGGTEATTTDANLALGRINTRVFLRRRDRRRHGASTAPSTRSPRGSASIAIEAARGIVRIAEQQHGQRAQAGVAQSRPRPARLHARRIRRRGRHARRRAGRRARHQESGRAAWRRGVLRLGNDDDRSPPRLFRDTRLSNRRAAAAEREALFDETEETALAQFAAEGVECRHGRLPRYGKLRYQNQEHSVEVAGPGGAVDGADDRSDDRASSTRSTSANTPIGSTRRSRWSASIWSHRPRSASSPCDAPATGRHARRRRQRWPRASTMRSKACTRRRSSTAHRLEPGMSSTDRRSIETAGTTIVVHPGNDRFDVDALRQHPHRGRAEDRYRPMSARRNPSSIRSRSRSSRTRCRRSPTRCSPPCARRR